MLMQMTLENGFRDQLFLTCKN